jgi:hypothetical protein
MAHGQEQRLHQQIRLLAAYGERAPRIAALVGCSPKTVKRLYQRLHLTVPTGRPRQLAGMRGGRQREQLRTCLTLWIEEGLAEILAGNGPAFLCRLATRCGLRAPVQLTALLSQVRLTTREAQRADRDASAVMVCTPRRCHICQQPYLAFPQRQGGGWELVCPSGACRRTFARRR